MVLNPLNPRLNERSLEANRRIASLKWWGVYLIVLATAAYVGFKMMGAEVNGSTLAWLVYIVCVVAIFFQPRYGIYMLVVFSLLGDQTLIYWWPFSLNFSSEESLLFFSESLIISPLESFIALTFLAWFARIIIRRKLLIYFSPLTIPALLFAGFMAFGLFYGVFVRNGDLKIALWEARPIFYLPALIILTTNLLDKREHIVRVMWFAIVGLLIEGFLGVNYFITVMNLSRAGFQDISAHSAAIHHNTVFVFLICIWYYPVSWGKRLFLLTFVPPVLLTYLLNQRRSSFLALGIAIALMTLILHRDNKRLFYILAPIGAVVGVVYLGIFWNNHSALALPAQAVKSVISDDADEADRHSNLYRILENANVEFTIQQEPLTGIGFGQKFYIVAPMADISFFEWWEYITHNSIIWIWMKGGVGGFFSMLLLVGMGLMTGVSVIWRMPRTEVTAVVVTAVMYIVMHFIFAYVDMSWDQQSMTYMGALMGIIGCTERIMNLPVVQKPKRYRWQADAPPVPQMSAIE